MIDKGESINDIYIQFKALQGILDKASYLLLEEILR